MPPWGTPETNSTGSDIAFPISTNFGNEGLCRILKLQKFPKSQIGGEPLQKK